MGEGREFHLEKTPPEKKSRFLNFLLRFLRAGI